MKKLNVFLLSLLISTNVLAASWECINRQFVSCNTWRMMVREGWIVSGGVGDGTHGYAMTYVPDPNHEWRA